MTKFLVLGLLVLLVATLAQASDCKEGDLTSFDDGCNTCICGKNGAWACTLKLCVSNPPREKRAVAECAVGDTKAEGCNKCFCTKTGVWACTRIGCP